VWLSVKGHTILSSPNYMPFGVKDLYRGLSGAIIGTLPVALVYFAVYESVPPFHAAFPACL
jgi:hypothetical protein